MMELYFLNPEVAGGHGEQTIYGTEVDVEKDGISAKVKFAHYEFEGWLGDDLLESTPIFIVSSRVVEGLKNSDLLDYRLEECLITTTYPFREFYPNRELPSFARFLPLGSVKVEGAVFSDFGSVKIEEATFSQWSGHHFCLSSKGELVVTKQALDFLQQFSMNYCQVIILTQQ